MLDIFSSSNRGPDQEAAALITLGDSQYPVDRKLTTVTDQVGKGKVVEWVSNGDWSMHELLLALLEQTGPAEVYLSSYAFSEKPARTIADLVDQKIITALHCIIDSRVDTRSASALTLIQNCASSCRLIDTHAKVTVIINQERKIAVLSSANYTTNHRYEAGVVIERDDSALFHKKWIMEAIHGADK